VWSINPKHDSVEALHHRLTAFAYEICKAKNIALEFEVSDHLGKMKLNPEVRRNLLLIAKEALHNMAKYSGSPSVSVRIDANGRDIALVVEDCGVGFDLEHAKKGNGLANVRIDAMLSPDTNPQRLPDCFSDKRANCFEFKSDGTVEFFDRDIYNGFTYQYAVSTFDYGFAGNVAPRGFDGDMVFSPRSAQESSDQAYPRSGSSNRVEFQVNVVASGNLDSVIVVPNPLRRQGGWDTGDQSTVRFVNVTRNATCEIFTLAGDLVRTLTNAEVDNEQRGNIQWDTRNGAGEEVASGVYLYRITDDQGGETIGRFTIIR